MDPRVISIDNSGDVRCMSPLARVIEQTWGFKSYLPSFSESNHGHVDLINSF